jgi:hypothetical protein
MNEHAFGSVRLRGPRLDIVDLGSGHFLRPIHELVRRDEPIGTPINARPDSPVVGFVVWHDCATEADSSWRSVYLSDNPALVLECGICGDHGSIAGAEWVKA